MHIRTLNVFCTFCVYDRSHDIFISMSIISRSGTLTCYCRVNTVDWFTVLYPPWQHQWYIWHSIIPILSLTKHMHVNWTPLNMSQFISKPLYTVCFLYFLRPGHNIYATHVHVSYYTNSENALAYSRRQQKQRIISRCRPVL